MNIDDIKIDEVYTLQDLEPIERENFDIDTHCVVDLWSTGQEVKVVAIAEVYNQQLPIVVNLADVEEKVSPIALEYLKAKPRWEDGLVTKDILCWVDDGGDTNINWVTGYDTTKEYPYLISKGSHWKNATPIKPDDLTKCK